MSFEEKISKEKIEEMKNFAVSHKNGREIRRVDMIAKFDGII